MKANANPLCYVSLATILLAACPVAHAGVVGVSGNVGGPWSGPPNSNSLRLNKTENNTDTQVFIEQTNMLLPSGVYYNAHNPGTYQQNSALVHNTIPANGLDRVNSYIFHFDPTSGIPTKNSRGSVDFSNEIYVISLNNDLDSSDVKFGIPGVQYATGLVADRGYDLAARDAFWISNPSSNVWRLTFEAYASTGMDELRVLEVIPGVPEPSSFALAGGSLVWLVGLRRRLPGIC